MIKKRKLKLNLHIRKLLVFLCFGILFVCLSGFSQNTKRVYDMDDLYSSQEEEELEQTLYERARDCETELILVTVSDYEGKDAQAYADDFYDANEFGYGSERTGFLLLINMEEREVCISNGGEVPRYFTDSMIETMISEIGGFLADNEYMDAAEWYSSYVEQHMWQESGFLGVMHQWWAQLLAALVLAAVIVLLLSSGHKTKMTVNSRTYLRDNKNKVRSKSDVYLRTSTTSHKIAQSSSGSGGSTHTSSSGTKHVGGSGHF